MADTSRAVDFKIGDWVVFGIHDTPDQVIPCPPGTPQWMREEMLWVAEHHNTQPRHLLFPTGRIRTAFRRVCNNCKKDRADHHDDKCLFMPTRWA